MLVLLAAVQGAGGTAVPTLSSGSRGTGWRTDAANATDAVSGLLARLGLNPDAFDLEMIAPTDDGLDTMQLGGSAGKVVVKGSSGVALASAVNW